MKTIKHTIPFLCLTGAMLMTACSSPDRKNPNIEDRNNMEYWDDRHGINANDSVTPRYPQDSTQGTQRDSSS